VNDDIGDKSVAVTYCPLTGTAIGWDRMVNGVKTTFGVSGKLYNTNLMPYDRLTDSYWSQIALNCVNGELISTEANTHQLIETTWVTWKILFPNSKVLNTNTGFNRDYNRYPYGDYRTNHDNIIFPVAPLDDRLPSKERVLGVLGTGINRAYSIELFQTGQVIEDVLEEEDLLIIGSKALNFIVAYENNLNLEGLEWNVDALPVVAQDSAGNKVRIDGKIVEGPLAGQQLNPTNSFIGYWFSLGAFYPGIELYEE